MRDVPELEAIQQDNLACRNRNRILGRELQRNGRGSRIWQKTESFHNRRTPRSGLMRYSGSDLGLTGISIVLSFRSYLLCVQSS